MTQVVLIRPWADARAGGGCCSGEVRDGVAPVRLRAEPGAACSHPPSDVVGEVYRRLSSARPDLDVQVVTAGNTLWLVPTVFRAARASGATRGAAAAAASRANRPGGVLLDGVPIGDLEALGADGVLAAVSERAPA